MTAKHEPTDANRQTVQLHATVGTNHETIARLIGKGVSVRLSVDLWSGLAGDVSMINLANPSLMCAQQSSFRRGPESIAAWQVNEKLAESVRNDGPRPTPGRRQ